MLNVPVIPLVRVCCVLLVVLSAVQPVYGAEFSELWGEAGERWSATSRLPDYSFAGYHFGEAALPQIPLAADVTRFGAVGDGKTDSTQAFIRAIQETNSGAIHIPAGTYNISDILWIEKPGLVLRGDGIGQSILHFTGELEDVRPHLGSNKSGRVTSNYSWSGGFIWVKGDLGQNKLSDIAENVARGSSTLNLSNDLELIPGQRITIEQQDDAGQTLLHHLYAGDPGNVKKITKPIVIKQVARVLSCVGKQVIIDRPLRFDLCQEWKPTLKTFKPTVSEVGIEDLSLDFPIKPYGGHFTERGMNGIAMNNVADCWVKNVQISNSDSGVFLIGMFCTIDGLLLESKRPLNGGTSGHHAIQMGIDCLCQNFEIKTHFIHDITFDRTSSGNVVKNGVGVNLSLDHHKQAPYENLICNVDVGKGDEIWRSGGGSDIGKHSAARCTFWCIRSRVAIPWPKAEFGPDMINIVGIKSEAPSIKDPKGKWYEAIKPEDLVPADLHAAQLKRRLSKQK